MEAEPMELEGKGVLQSEEDVVVEADAISGSLQVDVKSGLSMIVGSVFAIAATIMQALMNLNRLYAEDGHVIQILGFFGLIFCGAAAPLAFKHKYGAATSSTTSTGKYSYEKIHVDPGKEDADEDDESEVTTGTSAHNLTSLLAILKIHIRSPPKIHVIVSLTLWAMAVFDSIAMLIFSILYFDVDMPYFWIASTYLKMLVGWIAMILS